MSDVVQEFRLYAQRTGLKASKFPNRYHNGKVAIEIDRTNESQIIVSWEVGSGFERKRFRLTESVEDWLERAFTFARNKALESSQESLGLTNRTAHHRVRRGQV